MQIVSLLIIIAFRFLHHNLGRCCANLLFLGFKMHYFCYKRNLHRMKHLEIKNEICIIKTDLVVEKTTENVFASYTKDKEKSKECRVCSHGRCAYIYVYIYMRIYTYVLVISVRICKITTHPTNSYIQKIEFCIPSLIS